MLDDGSTCKNADGSRRRHRPRCRRRREYVIAASLRHRVNATYAKRYSSSNRPVATLLGNVPSSQPGRYTDSHSSPFALWIVSRLTASSSRISASSASPSIAHPRAPWLRPVGCLCQHVSSGWASTSCNDEHCSTTRSNRSRLPSKSRLLSKLPRTRTTGRRYVITSAATRVATACNPAEKRDIRTCHVKTTWQPRTRERGRQTSSRDKRGTPRVL
mmetsp:Transcript_24884/g.56722  ORF Transcript_24884/g.56722 Transcript_24884/m.56722 type:complete len:216 (-) Transcript_24884:642-1289(-)